MKGILPHVRRELMVEEAGLRLVIKEGVIFWSSGN